MNGCVEWQCSYSDEARAREGMGNIHAPAIRLPRTMAEGSGGPWPTANATGETACGTEWHEPIRKLARQSQGAVDWEA